MKRYIFKITSLIVFILIVSLVSADLTKIPSFCTEGQKVCSGNTIEECKDGNLIEKKCGKGEVCEEGECVCNSLDCDENPSISSNNLWGILIPSLIIITPPALLIWWWIINKKKKKEDNNQKINNESRKEIYCEKCGSKISRDAEYCKSCGKKI